MDKPAQLALLNQEVVSCERCPRLREWCSQTAREKKASTRHEEYWGQPIPHFGDAHASGLIIGLAPAAHGANRTGRMFTGDRSGDWLYRAMHKAGLASQPHSTHKEDGLELHGALITAVCHCAPPANKPEPSEISACSTHLVKVAALSDWKAVLCLGGIAFAAAVRLWPPVQKGAKFGHGVEAATAGPILLASYHPSQQNTFTGRLTEEMLDAVMNRFAALVLP